MMLSFKLRALLSRSYVLNCWGRRRFLLPTGEVAETFLGLKKE